MGPGRMLLLALACTWSLAGCSKKSIDADRSDPVATVHSFFLSLNRGHFPEHLDKFIGDDSELTAWKVRCKARGCKGALYELLELVESGENGATIRVKYKVYGTNDTTVMGNKDSVFRLERQGEHWKIVQFGRQLKATPKGDASGEDAAAATDAAPPIPDGGGQADAGTRE